MTTKHIPIVFGTLFAFIGLGNAQSTYLSNGQKGSLLTAQYINSDGASGVAGAFGYCMNGEYDFGLGMGRMTGDIGDLTYTSLTPYFGGNVTRPTKHSPVGFEMQVAYEIGSYSSSELDYYNWEMKSTGLSLSGDLYCVIIDNSGNKYYPSIGVARVTTVVELRDENGHTESSENDFYPVTFGVTEIMKNSMVFAIGLSFSNSTSALSAGIGYLF